MSLVVGTNSWVTVEEANTYLEDSPGAEDWFGIPEVIGNRKGEESRSSFLILAFRLLLNHNDTVDLSSSLSDDNVKSAQIEFALYLLRYREDMEQRQALYSNGVEEFSMGEWREKLNGSTSLPPHILSLLSDYTVFASGVAQLKGEDYLE